MRGPLETRYLEVHPGATAGLDACRYLERHPGRWFTHAELKSALGCSDRIIREHLPELSTVASRRYLRSIEVSAHGSTAIQVLALSRR